MGELGAKGDRLVMNIKLNRVRRSSVALSGNGPGGAA